MRAFGFLIFLSLLSCGKNAPSNNAGVPDFKPKFLPVDGTNIEGLYMAKFVTLNPHVNGTLPGSATLQRDGDKFYAYVRLFGGAPNAWHQQNVHEGTRCPTPGDDLNGDGYIDAQEGERVYGKILLPLDSNISSQKAGKNIYPVADPSGSYFYERVTSFNKVFSDLKSEDKDLNDKYVKLAEDAGLDFIGKVVVVHGTADTVSYPPTVASLDNRPAHQTLPIACGIFSQVTSIPGEVTTEEIPGPVGEPEGEVTPMPETTPEDDGTIRPSPIPESRPREERRRWYDRISDWWRRTWARERGNRRQSWGDGRWWDYF